jgi:threonylcarbamoyladenosine tRNA methylthiotransferase MtaB
VVSSKSVEEVVREIAAAAEGGAQEVVLTGIRLGAYGGETGETLAGLLHALREIKVARLRLSSLDPGDLNEDLIREMADHPRLCRHLHLPLQSGDDHILTLMNRGYTSGDFIAWVARWREVWPDVALTTDVMVGFPGETEAAFQRTCQVVEETGCSRLHVFAYSRRPGTAAAALPDQVAESIKAARSRELIALGKTLFRHYAEPLVGREVEVLFEQRDPATGAWEGLTESYVRVLAADARDWSGRFARVRVDDVARDHVTGSIVA